MEKQERDNLIKEIMFSQLSVGGWNGFCAADDLKENTSLRDDLGADSLDEVELIMIFEEEFDIEIDDIQAEQFKTVGDICNYIESVNAVKI